MHLVHVIVVCHFPPRIVITINTKQAVPCFIKAPGGTAIVTNGLYLNGKDDCKGMRWLYWPKGSCYSVKKTEMKIRSKDF